MSGQPKENQMVDTPQPATAGETELSRDDALHAAADVFKVSLGQAEPAEQPRGPDGKFISPNAGEEEEIEATDEGEADAEPEADAESQEVDEDESEAPDEGQRKDPTLPESWPAEKAEMWNELPPEARAFIAERDGQQKAALGARTQELANLRKTAETQLGEANANRQRYAEAVDMVMSLAVPQAPPLSMLDRNSSDYDPDEYHYQKAIHDQTIAQLQQHNAHRQKIAGQEQLERVQAINAATRDPFMKAVPDVADQAKAPAIFQGLIDYAVSMGAPVETFNAPTSALEWHVLWKAREYDRLQEAKAKVRAEPKPEPRKPQPAVRPGVTTPKSTIEAGKRNRALERLDREGSVDAGAAALKHLLKGRIT